MFNTLRSRLLAISRPVTLTLAGALISLNVAAILYGVFSRYIAGGAPIWTDELSRFLIIATVMLAAGAVWSEGGHMRVGLLEKLLPTPFARLLNVYQWVLTLLIAAGGAWVATAMHSRSACLPLLGLALAARCHCSRYPWAFYYSLGTCFFMALRRSRPLRTLYEDR